MPGVTLDRLKSVICQLKEKVNEYDVKFSAPLRSSDLLAFENENTVRLPEDYRLFLTLVGNGGPSGPCREGLLSLGKVPSLLYDKRTRIFRGLPDLFPFTEPSIITCPANAGHYQQSPVLDSNNSNSEDDSDNNSDMDSSSDGNSDDMDLDESDDDDGDGDGGESQDDYDTDASDLSDNNGGDDMDGHGNNNNSGDNNSNSSTNEEDNDDKYFPSTRTLFEDLFQLYDCPPFSVQRHDINTVTTTNDARINDDSSSGVMTVPMVGGYLILGTTEHSRHYFWILLCGGTCRGEIWLMNINGFYFPTSNRMQFHQWIDDWISGSDMINASVWTCGLYDLQLRVNSRYRNRGNNYYTSIYDSNTSSDDDDDDDQDDGDTDTDTECTYDDTDGYDDGDDITV